MRRFGVGGDGVSGGDGGGGIDGIGGGGNSGGRGDAGDTAAGLPTDTVTVTVFGAGGGCVTIDAHCRDGDGGTCGGGSGGCTGGGDDRFVAVVMATATLPDVPHGRFARAADAAGSTDAGDVPPGNTRDSGNEEGVAVSRMLPGGGLGRQK
ncbi:hypothetical protein MMPV_005841 [Pyropia vietnamensis]